jgi:polyferredoxin
VANRKAQTLTAFLISFALFVALIVLRYTATGCETIAGTALGILIVAPIANGWYHLAALCGARDADVFGILQKILPQNMKDEPPMTCMYSP